MATVNLNTKMLSKIQGVYVKESLVANKFSTDYSFVGAKTVKIVTPLTIPMTDYDRTASGNRYGTPTEMEDLVQELTLTQDKSFSLVIDKGNYQDQAFIKGAAKMMALQIKERAIPAYDAYVLDSIAHRAGTIVANSTALTKQTVMEHIFAGTEALDNAECPESGRTLFVPAGIYKLIKASDEFMNCEAKAGEALKKGVVGLVDNMEVVKVPASRWPANVNFIIAHRDAATAPVKINEQKINDNPQGISGALLEGRHYYDAFILGSKCNGVYVEVNTGSGAGTICATPTQSGGTFASTTSGASFKYTNDGSDPRYSPTAIAAASESEASGTVIRVYAYKTGCFSSAVFTYTA